MNNELITKNNELAIRDNILSAERFVKRTYLNDLSRLEAVPVPEIHKRFNAIRLYRVSKLIYDKNENINDKLVSVFNAVQNIRSNLVFIIKGLRDRVEFYVGVQSDRDIGIADRIFSKSLLGNFPGSTIDRVPQKNVESLLTDITQVDEVNANLTCLDVIPSIRSENGEKDNFIQGLEKFIDTMQGEEFSCVILGSSISQDDCEIRLRGFEELYSTLFPLANTTFAHGTSAGVSLTEGYTSTISESVSSSIAKTTGQQVSDTNTKGFNIGLFGMGVNTSGGHTVGSSTGTTESESNTSSTSEGRSASQTKTETINDNVTVNYKDKTVEGLLEDIDKRIDRIKECMVFGMWECAVYFLSDSVQTSVVAANAFRSLMLGKDNKNEKSHMNSLGNREGNSTMLAIESVRYCRHPQFRIADKNMEQLITATEYLSGQELPIMFPLPRKSVSGVTVTSMAEFGRNIVTVNAIGTTDGTPPRTVNIGRVSHMDREESQAVDLDLESLSAHCFITGSTGCGKSNTVFALLNELIAPEIDIPFLVVEPAKGEYKMAFAKVPGINIFTTTLSSGRFLKINPFRFNTEIHILEHLDRLIEIFNTCWEMYAAMPAILKDAIEKTYEKKGWDLLNSIFIPGGEPEFPTFMDLLEELPQVINSSGYSSDTKGDYTGALVTRVNSLTNGIAGQIFCDCYDVPDNVLFDERTIIDLSRVGSAETKSLIMGILVLKLTEYRMAKVGAVNSRLRHVTVLEEAHNLLKNSKTIMSSASNIISKSVEMICSSIAELRSFGEGFVLVDQSPGAVDIAAIKNTNTKIIMRLPEMSDCEAIGHSVSLNEEQTMELSRLRTGHAVVMQNNWTDAVMSKIKYYPFTYGGEIPSVSNSDLLKFKSSVVGEVLDEYAINRTRSLTSIMKVIDEYDIDFFKKEDARCMVQSICERMGKKWDNILFGKAMMRYSGVDVIFRRAENEVKNMPLASETDKKTDMSEVRNELAPYFKYVSGELSRMLSITDEQRRTLMQYILYVKAHESSPIDYDMIYRAKYIR